MDENKRTNLDFHKTFKPERNCLSSLLTDSVICNGKTIVEISQITGIPTGASSGKVEPTIMYLEYMGLIQKTLLNKRYNFDLTRLGNCILQEDPGLVEPLTLLLMHCYLCRPCSGAAVWGYIINNLFPRYHNSISKENLEKELQTAFVKQVNYSPFNGSYLELFEQLHIIKILDNKYSILSHNYNPEFVFGYGLILYEYWDEWIHLNNDITDETDCSHEITADLLEQIGFRNPFGWSLQEEYGVLESLHDKQIIELNRQMVPFSVRRLYSKEDIIDSLYSELC